jgi:hypothetical protein
VRQVRPRNLSPHYLVARATADAQSPVPTSVVGAVSSVDKGLTKSAHASAKGTDAVRAWERPVCGTHRSAMDSHTHGTSSWAQGVSDNN